MLIRFFIVIALTVAYLSASASDLNVQRQDFLKAEQMLIDKNEVGFLSLLTQLEDYPLYPLLKAQWLHNHLQETEQVKSFLSRFAGTRYANQVRVDWLDTLAEQQNWAELRDNFQVGDGIKSECLNQQANYQLGEKTGALKFAESLWLSGEDLPLQCNFIINAFKSSPSFSQALVWKRFDAALQHNRLSLAQYLKGLLARESIVVADFWLQLYNKPDLVQSSRFFQVPHDLQGPIYAFAVQRLVRKDPLIAISFWDARPASISIDAERQQLIEYKLALALANNKLPGAYARLMQVKNADEEIKEWRVRAALLDSNWSNVANAVKSLSAEEQLKPKWQYWLARASAQLGDMPQADNLFRQIASKSEYYGFLAADQVKSEYVFTDKPLDDFTELKTALLAHDGIKIVQELRHFHRDREAQKQWWFIIKKLDKEHIKAAAKLAQDWQWQHMAIFTLAKADSWDDLTLRFPLGNEQTIFDNASQQALDPMIVFGLIRQESAFDQAAASPVGARGLMQIMPATGLQIARELHEPWRSAISLFDPVLNIRFGVYYYKKLLDRFNGHFALAAAAYNAGPHRVSQWLPVDHAIPADVWVETIPFKETRKYVAAVLSYAVIYQHRLQKEGLKMHDLMAEVLPK